MNKVSTHKGISPDSFHETLIRQANECLECGKCTAACPMVELFPAYFNPHQLLERILHDPDNVLNEKDIWFCASCYRCNKRCPQGIELPEIFLTLRGLAVKKEKGLQSLKEALAAIDQKIPFTRSFFQVCFHPERIPLDNPTIDSLVINRTQGSKEKEYISPDKKIAVIGSGPAGLFAAWHLAGRGYPVTVFEAREKAGGMLQKSIPEYRMPAHIINKDLDLMQRTGVEIKTNMQIDRSQFDDLLKNGFKAVVIASGAHKCRRLDIPGENLPGVMDTLQFLEDLKQNGQKEIPQKVVVIGGGNTAMDAASAAARAGAVEVKLLYRRSADEIPADKNEIREVLQDGAEIQYLVAPVEIMGNNKVERIRCIEMKLGQPDLTGRKRPVPVEGSEFEMEADLVVVAIGERPALDFLPGELQLNANGTIAVNPLTMETSMPGVYAGGDAVSGPATVSEAIISAKKAVDAIDQYLKNHES